MDFYGLKFWVLQELAEPGNYHHPKPENVKKPQPGNYHHKNLDWLKCGDIQV